MVKLIRIAQWDTNLSSSALRGTIYQVPIASGRFTKQNGLAASGNGFGLVEIMIATAIITIAFFAFAQAGAMSLKLLRVEKTNLEATLLAQEGIEAVRAARDEQWTNVSGLSDGVHYYPIVENGKWKLTSTSPGLINGKFNRYVVFTGVIRYSSGPDQDKIAPAGAGGTYTDTGTRHVSSFVTKGSKTIQLDTYLTNFQGSLSYPQEQKVIFYEGGALDIDFGSFPSQNAGDGDVGQSFLTSSATLQVSKVELSLKRITSAPSNIYAEIRTSAAGTMLGTSQIINSSTITGSGLSWVEFHFDTPALLNPNTSYVIRLRSIPSSTDLGSSSQGMLHIGLGQSAGSPYPGGEAIISIGQLSNPSDPGLAQSDYDFSFRVYALQ